MKKQRLKLTLILSLSLLFTVLKAEVKLPHIFGSNMVLQANQPITVWGWAQRKDTNHFLWRKRTNQGRQIRKMASTAQTAILRRSVHHGDQSYQKPDHPTGHSHGRSMDLQRAIQHGVSHSRRKQCRYGKC